MANVQYRLTPLSKQALFIKDTLTQKLWDEHKNKSVYAILDGARDRQIEPWVRRSGLTYSCLYTGKLAPALRRAAPHLISLKPEDAFFSEALVGKGWGESWGIYAVSRISDIHAIAHHCRCIAKATGPQGERLVFRYYDPRVLREFLPTCSAEQLRQIFGPVERFVMEAPGGKACLSFLFDQAEQRLQCEQYSFEFGNEPSRR